MSQKRVVVYVRNQLSPKEMLDKAHEYCAKKGMLVVNTCIDTDTSGVEPVGERKAGKLLLEDAKAGKFDVLLVHSLDRLGRTQEIVGQAVNELKRYGVTVASLQDSK